MAQRFDSYLCVTEPTPQVLEVVNTIYGWYISDRLVFALLAALAQRGEEFVIECNGDYCCEFSSEDHLDDEVSKETKQWLNEILAK